MPGVWTWDVTGEVAAVASADILALPSTNASLLGMLQVRTPSAFLSFRVTVS